MLRVSPCGLNVAMSSPTSLEKLWLAQSHSGARPTPGQLEPQMRIRNWKKLITLLLVQCFVKFSCAMSSKDEVFFGKTVPPGFDIADASLATERLRSAGSADQAGPA